MGIVEESALKRKLMGQEANEQYYKASITKEKVSAVYEKNSIETVAEKSPSFFLPVQAVQRLIFSQEWILPLTVRMSLSF